MKRQQEQQHTKEAAALMGRTSTGAAEEALTPKQLKALLGKIRTKELICQRCHRLKHHNGKYAPIHPNTEKLLSDLRVSKSGLVVHIVDAADFPGSFIKDWHRFIGKRNSILVVVNKVDILPEGLSLMRVKDWFTEQVRRIAPNAVVHLASAKTGFGLFNVVDTINKMSQGEDVYLVGRPNAGKSEFINALMKLGSPAATNITTSTLPGTTMNLLQIPLDAFGPLFNSNPSHSTRAFLYDTPGVPDVDQLITFVPAAQLSKYSLTKKMTPRRLSLEPGRSFLIGRLVRIDYTWGDEPATLVFFGGSDVEVQTAPLRKPPRPSTSDRDQSGKLADIEPQLEEALDMTVEAPPKAKESAFEISFSGIGWVSISGSFRSSKWKVYSLQGAGVHWRKNPLYSGVK
ncbi:hypothetical protein HK102_011581 [Quaeritorhiza haematococci]|nr:hypothetical protein HK102_011581 [Quaeritorhiza haematococci]